VSAANHWLVKPVRSGGGNGISPWRHGRLVPRGAYLQRFIDGPSWSAVFVASNRGAMTLGLSRQLIGDAAFGADGFRYCGSIIQCGSDALRSRVAAMASALSGDFGLAGVNGVDFIRQDHEPVAIEVNPRWSGSMELVERAYGLAMFRIHAAACTTGELPPPPACAAAGAHGKAIVFARRTVTMGDTTAWLADADIRDVPRTGERIVAGRPVCTVFAAAADDEGCYAGLVTKARVIDEQLAGWRRNVA
jgi:predicted ATP-grasp superfamily ATP-dependent carboligase